MTVDEVGVLVFVHGARDLPSLLKGQGRVLVAPAEIGRRKARR